MGYIFQNYNLNKEETCAENVANALLLCGITDKEVIEKRVTAALTNVGMEKYAKRTPDTLSGGQQQRIAIARAIVKNPPIILADEPTGNLDEANTVMIMDLLKEISKEHLVLLVTHEANLVDYYCDMVVELSDGKVINIRRNENATGYYSKDKNAIYLGEYEKTEVKNENVEIEYYGEAVTSPLKLKVINREGKIYLRVDSSDVRILDNTSEVVLREGIYKENKEAEYKNNRLQLSELPPVSGEKFGKLFGFKKSIKSGYAAVSKKRKKAKTCSENVWDYLPLFSFL
jgi:ABC-type methionine transport system ATPase subunit